MTLGLIALAFTAESYRTYLRQQKDEVVKPAPAGWLVSFLVLSLNCAVQFMMDDGWSWGLMTVAAQAAGSLAIVIKSYSKGRLRFDRLDIAALTVVVITLIFAWQYQAYRVGTILTLVADGIGMVLIILNAATIIGAEHPRAWVINLGAGPPTIWAAAMAGDPMLLVTPIYLLTVDVLVIIAIYTKRWKRPAAPDDQSSELQSDVLVPAETG